MLLLESKIHKVQGTKVFFLWSEFENLVNSTKEAALNFCDAFFMKAGEVFNGVRMGAEEIAHGGEKNSSSK